MPVTRTPPRAKIEVEWIATREAAEILGRPYESLLRLGKRGALTMNRPGRMRPRWSRQEILDLARANGIDVSMYT